MYSHVLPHSLLLAISIFGFQTSRATPEQTFWKWFEANDNMLYEFEKDQDRTFEKLKAQLNKINPNLTFEFGPRQNGVREFVISADGIKAAFPAVKSLFAAAPSLPHWKFIEFRPRREPMDISFGDTTIKGDSVKVKMERAGDLVDLDVYVPGYSQAAHKAYFGAVFLMLDQALGEYDVETRVGRIQVEPAGSATGQTYSLKDLPQKFDDLFRQK
jgi:hypothetical protein